MSSIVILSSIALVVRVVRVAGRGNCVVLLRENSRLKVHWRSALFNYPAECKDAAGEGEIAVVYANICGRALPVSQIYLYRVTDVKKSDQRT